MAKKLFALTIVDTNEEDGDVFVFKFDDAYELRNKLVQYGFLPMGFGSEYKNDDMKESIELFSKIQESLVEDDYESVLVNQEI